MIAARATIPRLALLASTRREHGHSMSALHAETAAKHDCSRYFGLTSSNKNALPAVTGSALRTERLDPLSHGNAEHGPTVGERQGPIVNVLSEEKRLRVFAALVDGCSTRAVERMCEVHQRTVRKFALKLGEGAIRFHNKHVRDLRLSLIELDEIWSYVFKKQSRVTASDPTEFGEAYTWCALDASSRLAVSWCVGKRTQETADAFVADLRTRLVQMPQITSDGLAAYQSAVGNEFGPSAQFSQVVKNYSARPRRDDEARYEPPRGIEFLTKRVVYGAPNLAKATTAHIERLNCTTRQFVGRLRRLSLAFSKTLKGLKAAMALHYVVYNYCHVVRTLRVTPAMQAGLTDHVWELGELMEALLDETPIAHPEKMPLEHPMPEGPARALPGGRGFLRLLPGGGDAPSVAPATPPTPMAPIAPAAAMAAEPTAQLDLFAWKPKPREPVQLSLFGDGE